MSFMLTLNVESRNRFTDRLAIDILTIVSIKTNGEKSPFNNNAGNWASIHKSSDVWLTCKNQIKIADQM